MDKWKAEARRIRSRIKGVPPDWPFHLRPDLKQEHDRIYAEGRTMLSQAAALRSLALNGQKGVKP